MYKSDYKQCSHIINIFEKLKPADKGNLYLSSVYTLEDSKFRNNFKIDCVLTIIDNWCYGNFMIQKKLQRHGITNHKWIDIDDVQHLSIYPHLHDSHSYIRSMLNKTNVLVHCQMGMSRSSSLVIAFLMKEYGMSYAKAKKFTKDKRDIVQPNEGFQRDLLRFQEQLKELHPKINQE